MITGIMRIINLKYDLCGRRVLKNQSSARGFYTLCGGQIIFILKEESPLDGALNFDCLLPLIYL